MSSYTNADVQCPFFQDLSASTAALKCEGVLPGSSVKSHFGSHAALNRQLGRFCAGDYKRCPWFHVVSYRWEALER